MDQNETGKLKKKLELLGEPALPASLSAEALFRRMDEGNLALPEEAPEQDAPKVIPWARVTKRVLPVAACLALVLLLYQGQQTALAKNFSHSTTSDAAQAPAPAAAAPESVIQENADKNREPAAYSEGASPSSAAIAPRLANGPMTGVPQEEAAPAPQSEETAVEQTAPADDVGDARRKEKGSDSFDQATGGENDTGDAAPAFSDGWRTGPEYSLRVRETESQMKEIAQSYCPREGLIPCCFERVWSAEDDWVEFEVKYRNEKGETVTAFRFACDADWPEGSEVPRLGMTSCEEIDPDELF